MTNKYYQIFLLFIILISSSIHGEITYQSDIVIRTEKYTPPMFALPASYQFTTSTTPYGAHYLVRGEECEKTKIDGWRYGDHLILENVNGGYWLVTNIERNSTVKAYFMPRRTPPRGGISDME